MSPGFVRLFVSILALSSMSAADVASSQMTNTSISTGREDGNYYFIGQRLRTKMTIEHEYRIAVETSSGSVQNLARLADPRSDVGLALTQSDALGRFLQRNPEFSKEFIVLGDAGKECVVLIAARKAGVDSFAALKAVDGGEISVDAPGSGASATFDHLVAMDPGLSKVEPVFVDTMEALLQLKVAGSHTKLEAAMFVQRPSMRSPPVNIVLKNPADYRLVPILESDVRNSKLPDDSFVYTFEKVRVGSTNPKGGIPIDTMCVRSLLLASKGKLDRDIRSKLSRMMLESAEDVIGRDD